MADSRDITGKNRKFKGTSGIVLPKGTQAQRADTESGEIRYNTDTNLAEYYDGTEWKPIDAPPTITGVSPASPVDDGSTVTEITISGSNLQSGGTLTIIGNDTTSYNVASFTRVSSSSITFNYTSALAAAGVNTPYDIKYENPSGLAATLEDGFTPNTGPVWVSPAAGSSLGSINQGANASTLTQISVTDTSGGTLVYSIISGALPDGATISSSTGAISGVTTSSGTFTFKIQVTDGTTVIDRQFTATVLNPYVSATGGTVAESGDYKIHTFTGDGCFVVSSAGSPSGSTSVDYLVVAGGGGGGAVISGGGGAGGFRLSNSTCMPAPTTSPLANPTGITVTTTTYPITVGGGGTSNANGSNSVFSTITSAGGGASNTGAGADQNGNPGGSGGGASWLDLPSPKSGGTGNTPPTSPSQGNNGGNNAAPPGNGTNGSGGGGGAGAAGSDRPGSPGGGNGGVGSYVSPTMAGCNGTPGPVGSTRYFAGGGGGSSRSGSYPRGTGGSGGGGNGGQYSPPIGAGTGTANTGGGGGGNGNPYCAGVGGSGIVIIRYKFQ
jgi:hypothetical protein